MGDFGAQQKLIPNRESILEERGNGATVVTTVQKQVWFFVTTSLPAKTGGLKKITDKIKFTKLHSRD